MCSARAFRRLPEFRSVRFRDPWSRQWDCPFEELVFKYRILNDLRPPLAMDVRVHWLIRAIAPGV